MARVHLTPRPKNLLSTGRRGGALRPPSFLSQETATAGERCAATGSTLRPMSAVLVLHGITMSGPSILQHLGPVADAIRAQGLDLIAPTAARKIDDAEMERLLSWVGDAYEKRGQRALDVFTEGVFWDSR